MNNKIKEIFNSLKWWIVVAMIYGFAIYLVINGIGGI